MVGVKSKCITLQLQEDRSWIQSHLFRRVKNVDSFRVDNAELYGQLLAALGGRDGVCLLVRRHGKIAGYIVITTATARRNHGEVLALFVIERHRRQGIATMLLHEAVIWLTKAKVQSISVLVSPSNLVALGLYQSVGFKAATLEMEIAADELMSSDPIPQVSSEAA